MGLNGSLKAVGLAGRGVSSGSQPVLFLPCFAVESLPSTTVSSPHVKVKTITNPKTSVRKAKSCLFCQMTTIKETYQILSHLFNASVLCHRHVPDWRVEQTVTFIPCPKLESLLRGSVLGFQRKPALVWPGN